MTNWANKLRWKELTQDRIEQGIWTVPEQSCRMQSLQEAIYVPDDGAEKGQRVKQAPIKQILFPQKQGSGSKTDPTWDVFLDFRSCKIQKVDNSLMEPIESVHLFHVNIIKSACHIFDVCVMLCK